MDEIIVNSYLILLRHNKLITSAQAAVMMGTTTGTYNKYEYGEKIPDIKHILRLKHFYPELDINKVYSPYLDNPEYYLKYP